MYLISTWVDSNGLILLLQTTCGKPQPYHLYFLVMRCVWFLQFGLRFPFLRVAPRLERVQLRIELKVRRPKDVQRLKSEDYVAGIPSWCLFRDDLIWHVCWCHRILVVDEHPTREHNMTWQSTSIVYYISNIIVKCKGSNGISSWWNIVNWFCSAFSSESLGCFPPKNHSRHPVKPTWQGKIDPSRL